ncbi:MAG: hypothetical protein D6698_14220 [Gammaproteobacteria bacterium]|nr:MAG: hypothetical protein D6698_14220 [Gammaproteobacteria bacterium]
MSCGGRFKNVEGGGLPAVTNYNYPEENPPVRGPSNVKFRFEEVSSSSIYLFDQKSVNSDLEVFQGTTGAALTQSGSPTDTSSVSGWVALGDITLDVPDTGRVFTSGEFADTTYPSVTGRSLDKAHSVALINRGADPTYGNIAAIFQSGIQLDAGENYQFYVELRALAGSPSIAFWVEGYTGDYSISDAYNATNTVAASTGSTWTATRPAANFFSVPSGATGVSFDFSTSGFPGTTPTNYAIWVTIYGTDADSVVLVDNIYVDQYMQKDAFTSVILPSGYLLQVTPDLQWPDTLSMFEEGDSRPNPHLVTLGPYMFGGGLTDKNDGSVEITISSSDADKIFRPEFNRYLWRAVAVSDNGEIGDGGFPVRFDYVGSVLDRDFSVTDVSDDETSFVKVIRGKRNARLTILVNGGSHPGVSYPSATTWTLTYITKLPKETISLQAVDDAGALSSIEYVELITSERTLKPQKLWNVFDEYALLVGMDRLPGESNEDLSERIADAVSNPGSHLIDGIAYGASRELGLKKFKSALTFSKSSPDDGTEVTIVVTAFSLRIRHESYTHTETTLVHPVYRTAALEKKIYDDPTSVKILSNDQEVPSSKVSVFTEHGERPLLNEIHIDFDPALGELVSVVYPYYLEYRFSDYKTLGELYKAVKAAHPELSVVLDPELSGAELSNGLIAGEYTFSSSSVDLPWSPVFLKQVSDKEFKESFRNTDGSIWNTRLESWIRTLKSTVQVSWGNIISDKDYWDAEDNRRLAFDHVITLYDPPVSRFIDKNGKIYDPESAFARAYKDPSSGKIENTLLSYQHFIPGVASRFDLIPDLVSLRSSDPEISDEPSHVVGETGSEFIDLFTGNIV